MSSSKQNLRNLDTTVYRASSSNCDDDNRVAIQFLNSNDNDDNDCPFGADFYQEALERGRNFWPCPFPPRPFPPFASPTTSYALFFNAAATGVTYSAGVTVPFPSTQYNSEPQDIMNNGAGGISLSGGPFGATYLINYQLSAVFTDATVGLVVNGVNATSSNSLVTGTGVIGTASGSYIVSVPANTTTNVSLNVISGTATTGTPTSGSNISVVRIA